MQHRLTCIAPFLLLALLAAALFLVQLGRLPLLGRDEALYAEASREMFTSGDWITPRVNGEVFFEKPPLYYWAEAMGFKILGASSLAVRLPAALGAIAVILLTCAIGTRVWGRRAGLLAGFALALSIQMVVIGRLGIMDVPIALLTTLALLLYARWFHRGDYLSAAGFGAVVALAALTKGMAGLLAPAVVLVHLLIYRRAGSRNKAATVLLSLAVFFTLAAPWYTVMALRHGGEYGSVFFIQHHLLRAVQPMQGHSGPVVYYLGLILISFFPWVVFLPAALRQRPPDQSAVQLFWRNLAVVWFLVILIAFSLVRTKLPGYVTPLFPAMALLVGVELDRRLRQPGRAVWWVLFVASGLFAAMICFLPSLAAKVAAKVDAAQEARLLILPCVIWSLGCCLVAFGALGGLLRRPGLGVQLAAIGQLVVLGAIMLGILPLVSVYQGGAEARLAAQAQRDFPQSQLLLYDVNPEVPAFVIGRPVSVFRHGQEKQLLTSLSGQPALVLAPVKRRDFWQGLPAQQTRRIGDRVLLVIPALEQQPAPLILPTAAPRDD